MITEAEFVAIKAFDRTLDRNIDSAERIIAGKNSVLGSLTRRIEAQDTVIAALQNALAAERAKNASLMRQIRGVALARA